MIPDAEIKRNISPWLDLIFDEIIPRLFLVNREVDGLAQMHPFLHEVLIGTADQTQIAEVPIKSHVVLDRIRSNGRHYHIPAIPRVSGNHEGPGFRGLLVGSVGHRQYERVQNNGRQGHDWHSRGASQRDSLYVATV